MTQLSHSDMFAIYFECNTENQECKIFKTKSDTKNVDMSTTISTIWHHKI